MRTFNLLAQWALLSGLVLWLAGCTDAYMPDVITSPPSYLVIDGFLNSQGVTTIKLSRTYAVAAKTAPPVETRATLTIEDDAGARQLLTESSVKGTYTSVSQTLSQSRKYRLRIRTLAGQEYLSDFVPVKTTPPVDNVSWRTANNLLTIHVDAHDATNTTQYYRWETDETWEIIPIYNPSVEYANNAIRSIVVPYPSICWGTEPSKSILIDKTTALSQDVISAFQVKTIPFGSERLYTRYSILVQQHALTKEEYAYWELLRKNTESIGTLFDPQPAQVTGNVHCLSDASALALGFVSAHSVTARRLFIRRSELPSGWRASNGYEACQPPDSVFLMPKGVVPPLPPAEVLRNAFQGQQYLPIDPIYDKGVVSGYLAKSRDCVDCRTRGTSVRPSFW